MPARLAGEGTRLAPPCLRRVCPPGRPTDLKGPAGPPTRRMVGGPPLPSGGERDDSMRRFTAGPGLGIFASGCASAALVVPAVGSSAARRRRRHATLVRASHDRTRNGTGPSEAASYINPDTGMATENPTVNPNSECRTPDGYDRQRLSDDGTTNRNVHNDACLLEVRKAPSGHYRAARRNVDGPATFQSTGVGAISACPDPDGPLGPKVSVLTDTNGDGRNDRCSQSGYQERNADGDREFHVRLNNTTTPGRQVVTFCYDPDRDGCADERARRNIQVRWTSE